ncbi:hypothetical protein [Pannonibacter tanglangensis]|uniref:Uncharacterized protein n=1 Tax=Pannonibacter tanglangensis TaxID=2750084 RepID=A0ABW9ZB73_9HYPH|nr:hypothetical protein [Pannonibacter sp. XCT-34]NBN62075.1 hypothetical protein [Pannonibacter sp. XCT-34]
MIDLTKKWKTRDGEPVVSLALVAHGEKLSGLICGKNWGAWATWCPGTGKNRGAWKTWRLSAGEDVGFGRKSGWDLVPDEDEPAAPRFPRGCRVRKKGGSWWEGVVVGHYSTRQTPDGVCVQLEKPNGPVQIYPASAMEAIK